MPLKNNKKNLDPSLRWGHFERETHPVAELDCFRIWGYLERAKPVFLVNYYGTWAVIYDTLLICISVKGKYR